MIRFLAVALGLGLLVAQGAAAAPTPDAALARSLEAPADYVKKGGHGRHAFKHRGVKRYGHPGRHYGWNRGRHLGWYKRRHVRSPHYAYRPYRAVRYRYY